MPQTPRYSNVTTATRESITFDTADPRYKLARKVDTGSGSYGSTSPFRDPRRLSGSADTNNRFRGKDPGFGRGSWNWTGDGVEEASRRSTNKAVTVEARTVEGSTRQTLGNRARVAVSNATDRFGKGVSAAKGAAGKGTAGAAGATVQSAASSNAQSAARSSAASAIGKVVSSSASGGTSVGWYKGGFGVGVSAGGLDLGVGFASVSYNFSNPNESSIGGAFNTLTIKGTQEGCTITLDYQFLGKSYFKETRQADECTRKDDETGKTINDSDMGKGDENPSADDPEPGTSSTTTTTSTTGNWTKPGAPVELWVEVQSYSGLGRNAYEYDPQTGLYSPSDETWNDQYPAFLFRTPQFNGVINGEYAIKTVETRSRYGFSFAGRPYYEGTDGTIYEGEIDIKGTIRRVVVQYYLLERANENSTPTEYYLSTESDNWVTYTNFVFNQPSIFGPPALTVGNGSGISLLNSWVTSTFPAGITAPVDTFFYTRRFNKLTWIMKPTENNPVLPKTQTVSTPRGLKEPMEDRQQILLERVYQMLGGDVFWENGLAVPNQMFTPEGEGYTRTKSYNGVAHLLFDTLDHRTPGQVEYKLPNGMEYKSINAQGYFQDLGANVAETLEETKKKESNNSQVQNYLTRTAFINSQIIKILIQTNRIVRAILSFLNVPVSEEVENVDIPFDMSLGGKLGKKGFGSPKELDQELEKLIQEQLKTDPKAEKITAQFGNNGQTKITTVKVKESAEGGDFWWFIKQNLRGK